ncbi:hypothetical protein [Thalassoglobus sp.]|uniref:hypothetical protein n=1 Tax=Thalassoglobus sp. TaxID=2795869 RepID=UPI003AA89E46
MNYSFKEASSALNNLNKTTPVQHIGTLTQGELALELFGRTLRDGQISVQILPRRIIPGGTGKASSSMFFEPEHLFGLSTMLIEASGLIRSWKRPVEQECDAHQSPLQHEVDDSVSPVK